HAPTTPRRLAWATGRRLVDVVLAVDGLTGQGVCEVLRRAGRPAPARPAPPPAPAPDPAPPPNPDGHRALPRRRPGRAIREARRGLEGRTATGLPTLASAAGRQPDADLMARLIDGLRRL